MTVNHTMILVLVLAGWLFFSRATNQAGSPVSVVTELAGGLNEKKQHFLNSFLEESRNRR